jgi:hypothetical protein
MSSGAEFEEYVRGIYSILLNLKDEGIVVSGGANTFLKGISGETYQIDVYYEFERAGIHHKVIIECKDWKDPVKREVINALESKVRDIPGVIGVIISRNGYQSGAINFSQKKGILALTSEDLPSLGSLIGERLKTVALPDESCIGEPFWTIMMTRAGENTGVWFGVGLNREDERSYIPLFFSKYFANFFLEQMKIDKSIWEVRGLPQYALRGLIVQLEFFEIRHELFDVKNSGAVIMFRPPDAQQSDPFIPIPITREQIITEYYGKSVASIREDEH